MRNLLLILVTLTSLLTSCSDTPDMNNYPLRLFDKGWVIAQHTERQHFRLPDFCDGLVVDNEVLCHRNPTDSYIFLYGLKNYPTKGISGTVYDEKKFKALVEEFNDKRYPEMEIRTKYVNDTLRAWVYLYQSKYFKDRSESYEAFRIEDANIAMCISGGSGFNEETHLYSAFYKPTQNDVAVLCYLPLQKSAAIIGPDGLHTVDVKDLVLTKDAHHEAEMVYKAFPDWRSHRPHKADPDLIDSWFDSLSDTMRICIGLLSLLLLVVLFGIAYSHIVECLAIYQFFIPGAIVAFLVHWLIKFPAYNDAICWTIFAVVSFCLAAQKESGVARITGAILGLGLWYGIEYLMIGETSIWDALCLCFTYRGMFLLSLFGIIMCYAPFIVSKLSETDTSDIFQDIADQRERIQYLIEKHNEKIRRENMEAAIWEHEHEYLKRKGLTLDGHNRCFRDEGGNQYSVQDIEEGRYKSE